MSILVRTICPAPKSRQLSLHGCLGPIDSSGREQTSTCKRRGRRELTEAAINYFDEHISENRSEWPLTALRKRDISFCDPHPPLQRPHSNPRDKAFVDGLPHAVKCLLAEIAIKYFVMRLLSRGNATIYYWCEGRDRDESSSQFSAVQKRPRLAWTLRPRLDARGEHHGMSPDTKGVGPLARR